MTFMLTWTQMSRIHSYKSLPFLNTQTDNLNQLYAIIIIISYKRFCSEDPEVRPSTHRNRNWNGDWFRYVDYDSFWRRRWRRRRWQLWWVWMMLLMSSPSWGTPQIKRIFKRMGNSKTTLTKHQCVFICLQFSFTLFTLVYTYVFSSLCTQRRRLLFYAKHLAMQWGII